MKKTPLQFCRYTLTFLCFLLCSVAALDTHAQACGTSGPAICTPTAGLDSPGFYPSDTALPCVTDGQAYNQVINLVAPATADNFPLDSIRIATLTNLPCGLCWASGNASNTIIGGKPGCIRVTGTSNEAPGEYDVLVYATAWVHLFGSSVPLGPLNADSALGLYYYIRVVVPGGTCQPVDTSAGKGSQASTPGSITTPTITGNTTVCPGNTTTLTATGGSYYGYAWSNGATTSSITVGLGTYTVSVYENCNSATASVTVTSAGGAATISAGGPTTFCQGGSVVLTASAGSAWLWSDGETTQAITVSTTGSYTVQVTNNGCSATSSATTVTVFPSPSATITPSGPTTFCQGGSVSLTAAAGNTYTWSTGSTAQSITVTTTGTYRITVVNSSGCMVTGFYGVNVLPPPSATITPSGPTTFCQGGNVTLSAPATGTWAWSTGATTQSINVTATGSYLVTVTGSNTCTAFSGDSVIVNPLPTATIGAGGPTTFCQGGNVTLTASAGSSWLWSNGATTQAITVSATGSFTVQVTNARGCSATSSATPVTVNQPPSATISAGSSTTFCQGGSVTLTASAGSSWLWSNGATTQAITVSATGSFTVQVTNNSGCSATSSATSVTVNALPSATISAGGPTTFCTGGSVTLTASAGSSWLWSDGETTQAITVSAAGNYTVQVTNANNCSATSSATTVTVNSNPTATITPGGPTTFCQGGSVTLSASTGTAYLWSSGETTQQITVSASAIETVSVTFAGGCSGSSVGTSVIVNANPTASVNAGGATTFCAGGSVTLTASAGSSWLWSDGETTQAITVSSTGNYSVQVTNANGCSATSSATTVTVNSNPTATISAGGPTTFCNGGHVVLTASAGASWLWSDGETTQAITVTSSGSFTVQVTNAGGCSATSAATVVTVGASGTATITASGPTSFCKGDSVILTASAGVSYKWTNRATTQSITVKTTTDYKVTVSFGAGCGGISPAVQTTENPLPTAVITVVGPDSVCSGQTVSLTASSGTSYAYLWSDGETSQGIAASATGAYKVTVTDGNGCKKVSAVKRAYVFPTPAAIIESNIALTFCAGDSAKLTAYPGGTNTYAWSTGAATRFIYAKTSGVYDVTVTTIHGCSSAAAPVQVTADCSGGGGASKTEAVGTADATGAFEATVYPNPYSGQFNVKVQSSNITDNVNVRIYDINGKLMEEKLNVAYGTDVMLGNNYASGVYIVRIQQAQTTKVLRVVKAD